MFDLFWDWLKSLQSPLYRTATLPTFPVEAEKDDPVLPQEATLTIDQEGWLVGHNVVQIPAKDPEGNVRFSYANVTLTAIVWHYTAMLVSAKTHADNMRSDAQKHRDRQASAHLFIDDDGTIYQCIPFSRGAWHVGPDPKKRHYIGGVPANRCAAGIEVRNAGLLKKRGNDYYTGWWRGGTLRKVDPVRVVKAGGRYWEKYSPEQFASARLLCAALVERYDIPKINRRFTHAQLNPDRRTDPGPLWEAQFDFVDGLP